MASFPPTALKKGRKGEAGEGGGEKVGMKLKRRLKKSNAVSRGGEANTSV